MNETFEVFLTKIEEYQKFFIGVLDQISGCQDMPSLGPVGDQLFEVAKNLEIFGKLIQDTATEVTSKESARRLVEVMQLVKVSRICANRLTDRQIEFLSVRYALPNPRN